MVSHHFTFASSSASVSQTIMKATKAARRSCTCTLKYKREELKRVCTLFSTIAVAFFFSENSSASFNNKTSDYVKNNMYVHKLNNKNKNGSLL